MFEIFQINLLACRVNLQAGIDGCKVNTQYTNTQYTTIIKQATWTRDLILHTWLRLNRFCEHLLSLQPILISLFESPAGHKAPAIHTHAQGDGTHTYTFPAQ